jgi:hypothetical protein
MDDSPGAEEGEKSSPGPLDSKAGSMRARWSLPSTSYPLYRPPHEARSVAGFPSAPHGDPIEQVLCQKPKPSVDVVLTESAGSFPQRFVTLSAALACIPFASWRLCVKSILTGAKPERAHSEPGRLSTFPSESSRRISQRVVRNWLVEQGGRA